MNLAFILKSFGVNITPVLTGDCFGFGNYVEGPAVLHVVTGSPGTIFIATTPGIINQ